MDVITGQPLYGMTIASPKPACTSTSTSTGTGTGTNTRTKRSRAFAKNVINDRLLAVDPTRERRKSGQLQP